MTTDGEGATFLSLWGEPVRVPINRVARAKLDAWDRRPGEDQGDRRRRLAREANQRRAAAGNPLLARFGAGPDGAKCGTCTHLYAKRLGGTYYKCDLRGNTGGPGTDHRVRWPACGRYERREDGEA